ncbi:MAG: hypothetical protein WC789_13230 [Lentisphaeria bacterium]|jgi:hypothetical protein
MNEIVCKGLDGANPLHMLASLGLFRLLCLHDANAKMAWRMENAWHPAYHTVLDEAAMAQMFADDLVGLGKVSGGPSPEKNRKVREVGAALKKVKDRLKEAKKVVDGEAKQQKLVKEAKASFIAQKLAPITAEKARLENELAEAQAALNDALGEGIAHLGDIIGVAPDIFRRRAEAAVQAWLGPAGNVLLAEALSAQAVDGVGDAGKMIPTPFSFRNDPSGRGLLKDFRNCAAKCSGSMLLGMIKGHPTFSTGIKSLDWDPLDQRAYALQWQAPKEESKSRPRDIAANSLAFVGLGFMTLVPDGNRHAAVAWVDSWEAKGFVWPVWTAPLGLDVIRALLAIGTVPTTGMGIGERFFGECINPTGKRNFFAPARPV